MEWENSDNKSPECVIFQHRYVKSTEAEWLCIENIYEKLARPNFFDIGGTYKGRDIADYWFMMKTEQSCDNVYLLHLFVTNRHDGSFQVSVSASSDILYNSKSTTELSKPLKQHCFENAKEKSYNYITTYKFTDLEVDLLKDKTLYIPILVSPAGSHDLYEVAVKVKFEHDLGFLLNNPLHSDFAIKLEDGSKYKVHKAILSAHSEVFQAMLKDDTAENQENIVKLEDIEKRDLQNLLEFIYTGTLKNLDECNWINLLKLSDRYSIFGLMELAQYALSQTIDKHNVFEILFYADTYNSNVLRSLALDFIKNNTLELHNTFIR